MVKLLTQEAIKSFLIKNELLTFKKNNSYRNNYKVLAIGV